MSVFAKLRQRINRDAGDSCRGNNRLAQSLVGLALVGVGCYVTIDDSSDALALAAGVAFLILGGNALLAASRSRQSWLFAIGAIY